MMVAARSSLVRGRSRGGGLQALGYGGVVDSRRRRALRGGARRGGAELGAGGGCEVRWGAGGVSAWFKGAPEIAGCAPVKDGRRNPRAGIAAGG